MTITCVEILKPKRKLNLFSCNISFLRTFKTLFQMKSFKQLLCYIIYLPVSSLKINRKERNIIMYFFHKCLCYTKFSQYDFLIFNVINKNLPASSVDGSPGTKNNIKQCYKI